LPTGALHATGLAPVTAAVAARVALAAVAATGATAALRLGDLRRREPQRRAHVLHVELDHGPLLAVLLVRPLLEPARHDDLHAFGERFRNVLSVLTPDRARHEEALTVGPSVRGLVERAGRRGDAEAGDRRAGLGESEFGIRHQRPNHRRDCLSG